MSYGRQVTSEIGLVGIVIFGRIRIVDIYRVCDLYRKIGSLVTGHTLYLLSHRLALSIRSPRGETLKEVPCSGALTVSK